MKVVLEEVMKVVMKTVTKVVMVDVYSPRLSQERFVQARVDLQLHRGLRVFVAMRVLVSCLSSCYVCDFLANFYLCEYWCECECKCERVSECARAFVHVCV